MSGPTGDLLASDLYKEMKENGGVSNDMLASLLGADEMGYAPTLLGSEEVKLPCDLELKRRDPVRMYKGTTTCTQCGVCLFGPDADPRE